VKIQPTLDGEFEVYVMGRHNYDGTEARTIVLDTLPTYELAEAHIRVLERNGGEG
jgi:hypothetical protein